MDSGGCPDPGTTMASYRIRNPAPEWNIIYSILGILSTDI